VKRVGQGLHDYFAWATTTTMSRYHRSADDVPDGLDIPHWSWAGFGQPPVAGSRRAAVDRAPSTSGNTSPALSKPA